MRLFIAWPLPASARTALQPVTAALKQSLPAASWPRTESMHVTFAFLGEHPAQVVAPLSAALDRTLSEVAPLEVRLGEPGFFPNARRPRVGWIAIEPAAPLTAIAGQVREAAQSCGVSIDEKPFRPHLTLCRTRDRWRRGDCDRFQSALEALERPPMILDRIALYDSVLSSSGATHQAQHAVDLRRSG